MLSSCQGINEKNSEQKKNIIPKIILKHCHYYLHLHLKVLCKILKKYKNLLVSMIERFRLWISQN